MNKDSIMHKLRNRAEELDLNYNAVLSKFFFDEFLRLLANSKYSNHFILKGGMLLTHPISFLQSKVQTPYSQECQ